MTKHTMGRGMLFLLRASPFLTPYAAPLLYRCSLELNGFSSYFFMRLLSDAKKEDDISLFYRSHT